jgi:hypothetical protein
VCRDVVKVAGPLHRLQVKMHRMHMARGDRGESLNQCSLHRVFHARVQVRAAAVGTQLRLHSAALQEALNDMGPLQAGMDFMASNMVSIVTCIYGSDCGLTIRQR